MTLTKENSEVIAIFRRYCRAISDRPEIWDAMLKELPAAIYIDCDRLDALVDQQQFIVRQSKMNKPLTKI